MRKTIFVVLALVAMAAAIGAYMIMHMSPPNDLDLSRSKATANGLCQVTIAPESEPLRQGPLHAWILTVETPDGVPVDGAEIAIDGGMPQHGHGLPTSPAVTGSLGDGRYRIEGVRFNMGGWWELKFAIVADGRMDEVDFNIVL